MKILALGANSTKCCIHNLWAPGELEMQKLGAGVLCRGPGVGLGVGGMAGRVQGGCGFE